MSHADYSRRRFLLTTAGVLVAGLAARRRPAQGDAAAPPHASYSLVAGAPITPEQREYFTALEDYQELPPECYQPNLIRPREIILHWDGNTKGRDLWLVQVTYQTLSYLRQSAHFAVDHKRVWQMLPMYQTVVQESHGARGFNWKAINVEMAGVDFDSPEHYPEDSAIRLTVRLISQLMDHYGLALENVVGHYERDERGDKRDPGVKFMADLRARLRTYRASLSPLKRQALGG